MKRHLQRHKYFKKKVPRGLKYLFANYIVVDLASGLFSVFLPIFLYEFFNKNIQPVFAYYALGYILTLFVIIIGARRLNKFGFKRALKVSTFFSILFFVGLFFLTPENIYYVLPIIITALSIKRLLYWIPYNIDFAKFADSQDRGKTMGALEIVLSITGVVTPLIAGFVISNFGFGYLFILGIIIFMISYIPLVKLPRTREKFSWSIKKTIRKIFAKENRTTSLVFFAEGAEGIVFAVVWPIFVFQILKGNYLQVGFISTFTVVIVIIAQYFVGKKADGTKKSKEKLVKLGGVFYSLAWVFKAFILTALHVFVIDIFHKLTQIFYKIPLNTLVFEKAAGQKHLVDEFIVFLEICLNA